MQFFFPFFKKSRADTTQVRRSQAQYSRLSRTEPAGIRDTAGKALSKLHHEHISTDTQSLCRTLSHLKGIFSSCARMISKRKISALFYFLSHIHSGSFEHEKWLHSQWNDQNTFSVYKVMLCLRDIMSASTAGANICIQVLLPGPS